MKSILVAKKLLGLVEMTSGLVNASLSLPQNFHVFCPTKLVSFVFSLSLSLSLSLSGPSLVIRIDVGIKI